MTFVGLNWTGWMRCRWRLRLHDLRVTAGIQRVVSSGYVQYVQIMLEW
jgi:hypothetical protein